MTLRKLRKMYYLSGAAFTVGTLALAGDAHAQAANSFNTVAKTVATNTQEIPGLITSLSYLIGTLLGALGVMKIKDHVENPTQTPLKDGAIRLAVGGALFALPSVMGAMQGSMDDGGVAAVQGLNKAAFQVK